MASLQQSPMVGGKNTFDALAFFALQYSPATGSVDLEPLSETDMVSELVTLRDELGDGFDAVSVRDNVIEGVRSVFFVEHPGSSIMDSCNAHSALLMKVHVALATETLNGAPLNPFTKRLRIMVNMKPSARDLTFPSNTRVGSSDVVFGKKYPFRMKRDEALMN